MSRFKRQTPIFGNASGSEKQDKRYANRAGRTKFRNLFSQDIDTDLIDLFAKDVSNVYTFKKDGKRYLRSKPDIVRHGVRIIRRFKLEWMRK